VKLLLARAERHYQKGDIVKFRKTVDTGDEDLRMILLEARTACSPGITENSVKVKLPL
jgi:hypothetical protein